jgi:DNA-binding transcriptional MerR regulator
LSATPSLYPDDERLYGISEVSRVTGLKAFVLRYWQSEFPMLAPAKSHNKHRMYRQQDVDLVLTIKRLLYDEGFTIAGARRHLEDLMAAGIPITSAGNTSQTEVPSETAPLQIPASRESASIPAVVTRAPSPAKNALTESTRQMLLEVRDSLRTFLTLLERK